MRPIRDLSALGFAASLVLTVAFGTEPPAHQSDDLGTVGPQFPIQETDMLDAILARAREKQNNGEAQKLEQHMREQAQGYATAPPSLNLPRAGQDRRMAFDPSVYVPSDIKDASGRVMIPAGTSVNPLQHFAFDETLFFVDASDPDQVAWLKQRLGEQPNPSQRVILTGGSPTQLAEQLKQAVYFDQNGALVKKFGIGAVPATVLADPQAPRQRLLVQEYDPREKQP
ncbi:MAG: type-F conjugative transfer system protein TraW [Nevskia sp.]|nr:type-F conjugative transfer system protein TraW [Nevskia sp.]